MAVVSVVKLSELEGAKRIDAECYKPEYLVTDRLLLNRSKRLFSLAEIKGGKRLPIGETFSKGGVSYVRVVDIQNFYVDLSHTKKISLELHKRLSRYQIKKEEIGIAIVGNTIGLVGFMLEDIERCNLTENCAKLVARNISPYYLSVYLASQYGQHQIKRLTVGTGQPKFGLDKLAQLRIFIPSSDLKQAITNDNKEAYKHFSNSHDFYSQAQNLLLEELGLKDFKPKYELSYTANLSKAFGVHRVDAEYFQPAYDEMIKRIMAYSNGYTQLLNCVESIKPDFDTINFPDRTFSYVELSDIDASIGIIHSVSEIKGEDAPSRARRILRKNDVIVSSVEGSLEKVALIDKEHEGSLASTGFFQFRAINIYPEVLLVLSKSIVLQTQLKKECAGTILTAVPTEALKRILIPVIPDETQQKIASLIEQSHEARRKAKELLEEAKRKVEEAIENEIQK